MTPKELKAAISEARQEADRMVAGLHERAQSQDTFRSELTMLANRLHALDGAEPIAEPSPTTDAAQREADLAKLRQSLGIPEPTPAGEADTDRAVDEAPPAGSRRRRPALAGRKPAKHSRAANKR